MANNKGADQNARLRLCCLHAVTSGFLAGIQKNGAATCDLKQCDILTSVDSDEPVQPPVKLRNSKLCLVGSLTTSNALIRLRVCAG